MHFEGMWGRSACGATLFLTHSLNRIYIPAKLEIRVMVVYAYNDNFAVSSRGYGYGNLLDHCHYNDLTRYCFGHQG